MVMGSHLAQALKSVWVGQHLTPLLGQRGEASGEILLLSHADLKQAIFAQPPKMYNQLTGASGSSCSTWLQDTGSM